MPVWNELTVYWFIVISTYRNVVEGTVAVLGLSTVIWDEKEGNPAPVAGGLYRFVVKDDSGKTQRKPIGILR